jgi:hypothetical protein
MLAPLEVDSLATLQSGFAASLLSAEKVADRRFFVHRNNVKASLGAALAARFPVVWRLVGVEFFRAMAVVFVERHPPRSPVLAAYGAGFADFLDGFEPVADLPYLADVARLEWARHLAWHAADAPAISIEELTTVAPNRLDSVRLRLHPAATVVVSIWPVISIWTTNILDEEIKPIGPDQTGESALVTRPGLEIFVNALPPGTGLLFEALSAGIALGEAVAQAERAAGFDTAAALSLLFRSGAVTSLAVD